MQTFGANNTTLRNSGGTSQHFSLSLLFYTTNQAYKELLDKYNALLESRSECKLNDVVSHEEEMSGDSVRTPLFPRGAIDAAKLKLKHISLESEIKNRENQIREWHRSLSSTFQSRYASLSPPSSANSEKSFDIEVGLVTPTLTDSVFEKFNPSRTPMAYQERKSPKDDDSKIDFKKCILSYIVVLFLTLIILATVGTLIYFMVYSPSSLGLSQVAANNQTASSNTPDNQGSKNNTDEITANISLELNFTETELITTTKEDEYRAEDKQQTPVSTEKAPGNTAEETTATLIFSPLANDTDNTTTVDTMPPLINKTVTKSETYTQDPILNTTATETDTATASTANITGLDYGYDNSTVDEVDLESMIQNITTSSAEDPDFAEDSSLDSEVNSTLPDTDNSKAVQPVLEVYDSNNTLPILDMEDSNTTVMVPILDIDDNNSNTTEQVDFKVLELTEDPLLDTNSTVTDVELEYVTNGTKTELVKDLTISTTLNTLTIIDDPNNSTLTS